MQGLTGILLLFFVLGATAQTHNERLYRCFVTEQMSDWETVILEKEKSLAGEGNAEAEFELLHAQYGYIAYLIGQNNEDRAKKYIDKAEKHIVNILAMRTECAEVLAIQSAINTFKIAINPYKVLYLGKRSINLLNRATAMDPQNVYVVIELGNYKLYAPEIANGNVNDAIKCYLNAIEMLKEQNGNCPPKTWWYINTQLQLAIAYKKSYNPNMEKLIYKQILDIEPNCKWAKKAYKKLLTPVDGLKD